MAKVKVGDLVQFDSPVFDMHDGISDKGEVTFIYPGDNDADIRLFKPVHFLLMHKTHRLDTVNRLVTDLHILA